MTRRARITRVARVEGALALAEDFAEQAQRVEDARRAMWAEPTDDARWHWFRAEEARLRAILRDAKGGVEDADSGVDVPGHSGRVSPRVAAPAEQPRGAQPGE